MEALSSPLEERLRLRIAREGLLTYAAFVETVLYDEDYGYYKQGKEELRDYATSPEIHSLFGMTIGRYLERLCASLKVQSVTIIELGGASGKLARDIISAFSHLSLDRYVIVEHGREMSQGPMEWRTSLDGMPVHKGFVFVVANEFFDALPFHKVVQLEGALHEVCLGYHEGFFEQPTPLSDPLRAFLRDYPVVLRESQVLEVTPRMVEVIEQVSAATGEGGFLIFDYGYHRADIASGRFFQGSALGYKNWTMQQDILNDVGRTDITHHVNFDHLCTALQKRGWRKEGEIEQYRFLFNIGIVEGLGGLPDKERMKAKWLLQPEGLGSMVSVLGFSKGRPLPFAGFR